MQTIYRCPDCGYETSDRCYGGRIRFNKKTETRDRRFRDIEVPVHVWNSGNLVEACTEDLSEEHEKKLKNEMLQAAVDYRAARIEELYRELGELKSRMSPKDLS